MKKPSKVNDRATLMASLAAFNNLDVANRETPGQFYYSYLQWKKSKEDFQAMKIAAQYRDDIYKVGGRMIAKRPS